MASQRRIALLSIAVLLTIFGGGAFVAGRLLLGEGIPLLTGGRVAVLPVVGIIENDRAFLRAMTRYRDSDAVKAFVLEIRSPGGGVGASQSIFQELVKLREEDERPIIAWIGDIGASGGYYVSLAADSIFALPGSITGSIGVIMQFPQAQELLRKVGLGWEVVKSGEYKDIGSPTRPLSEEDRRILQGVVDDVYNQFITAVAENRKLERDSVVELADGRIYSGERAVELGLVDRLATLPEAIGVAGRMAGLGERPTTVRPVERRVGLFDVIAGLSESRLLGWLRALAPQPAGTPRLLYQWR
ncbi:MAG: signal peptide peptidase SppA [Gemmatimonadota bacterium]